MLQTCRKCGCEKPLDDFQRRPDSRSGIRRTCKECRRFSKNAANRRWYSTHRDREQTKRHQRRLNNLEKYRMADARYRFRHQDAINAKCREYYRKHRDRLIRAAIERRKRYRSLDFGWQYDLHHDVVQYQIWKEQQSLAADLIADLFDQLTAEERACCQLFMENSTPLPPNVLVSIRAKAGSLIL